MLSWYHHLRRLLARAAGPPHPSPGSRRRRIRPTLEALEERCVLDSRTTPLFNHAFVAGISSHGVLATMKSPYPWPSESNFAGNEQWTFTYTDDRGDEHQTPVLRDMNANGPDNVVDGQPGYDLHLTQTFPDAGLHFGVAHLTGGYYYNYTTKTVIGAKSWDIPIVFYVDPTPQVAHSPGPFADIPLLGNYGAAPPDQQTPLGRGKKALKSWEALAVNEAQGMFDVMSPPRSPFLVVLPGEFPGVKSMTVFPLYRFPSGSAGVLRTDPVADELAQAASRFGFWVDASGVLLSGELQPSPPRGPSIGLAQRHRSGTGHLNRKGSVTVYLIDSAERRPRHFQVPLSPSALEKLPRVIQSLQFPAGTLKWTQAPHLELFLRPGSPPPPLFPSDMTWEQGFEVPLLPDG